MFLRLYKYYKYYEKRIELYWVPQLRAFGLLLGAARSRAYAELPV